jgi:uncharacterized protein (TIGR02001 family)
MLASADVTRQTRGALRKALRETLPVTRSIGALLLLMTCAVAHADAIVTGSVGATSDFVFRGLSLTRGKPAAQASIDVEFPHEFYVGAFVATADPNAGPSPPVELDAWAGRYWRVSEKLSADVRVSQYSYPDDPRRVSYDRSELTGTLGWNNQLFVAAIYSPNTKAISSAPGYQEGNAWALELSGRRPLDERWSLSAGVGHYDLEEVYGMSYNYWNATVTATLSKFELQLAYLGVDGEADEHFASRSTGDRVAFTALWRFSSAAN